MIVRREEMGLFRSIIKIEQSQSDLFKVLWRSQRSIYMTVSKQSSNVKARKGIFRAYEIVTMRESIDLVGFFSLLLYLNKWSWRTEIVPIVTFLFFCRSVSLSDKTKMGAANTILPIIINSVGTHTNIVS